MANLSAVKLPNGTKVNIVDNTSGFVTTDTKNTAGSTSSNSKLFLVGATSQADYAQTYSSSNLYYQNGLYSKSISGDYTSYLRQQYNEAHFNVGDDDYTGGLNITRNSAEIFGEGPNTGTSIVVDDDQIALRGANDTVGGTYVDVEGTTSAVGNATFTLGNNIASGTKNNKQGKLALYGSTAYSSTIDGGAPTANRTVSLPNKSGTVALTSDLPTVNNATLTIQKNGITVNSFTANASSNVTANITVPTKTSDLTNDNSVKSVTESPSTALDGTIAVTTGGENGISITSYVPVKGVALQSNIPTTAGSNTTGISVSDHSTSSIYGVQSSTTTASKVTLGTALSVTGVSGSTTASKVTVGSHSTDYGVKAAGSGSFTSGAFSGGSGSFSATVTDHVLSFSHSHTAATHGADSHSHTAPTLGSKVPTVSASDVTVPKAATSATSIPNVTAATDVTVPIKNSSSTTVVTGKSHTVTDNGHTHTLG